MDVAVQIPAIDEPPDSFRRMIRETLAASTETFNPTYEAWVTPVEKRDRTARVAREEGLDVYEAPEGKISTRNAAHDHAFETGHDAVIEIDADAPPLNDDALDAMIEPLYDDSIAAVNSIPMAMRDPDWEFSVVGAVVDIGGFLEDVFIPHFHGQCGAFREDAWRHAGPFDESVDQKNSVKIRREEEYDFYWRLRECGDVVYPKRARFYNDPRRHVCHTKIFGDADYCDRRGELTFEPSSER